MSRLNRNVQNWLSLLRQFLVIDLYFSDYWTRFFSGCRTLSAISSPVYNLRTHINSILLVLQFILNVLGNLICWGRILSARKSLTESLRIVVYYLRYFNLHFIFIIYIYICIFILGRFIIIVCITICV